MVELEDYKIDNILLKILSKLPYRLECKLEELIIKMAEGMEGKISDFDNIDFEDLDIATVRGFNITKKMDINNFLLQTALIEPSLTQDDLNNDDHPLNDKFKEIGDHLFNKYITQYNEKTSVKKKPTISPS